MKKTLLNSYKTSTPEKTYQIGFEYGKNILGGETILMFGEAGAGKTVFTKGLAKGLGIDEKVLSPTFAIRNDYQGVKNLHHLDMYRISDMSEIEETGVFEGIFDINDVTVIEWAENVEEYFDFPHTEIKIYYKSANKREIEIYKAE